MTTLIATLGADLKVGDTLAVVGGRATIIKISPYVGRLDFGFGASTIEFGNGRLFTVEHTLRFDVVAP